MNKKVLIIGGDSFLGKRLFKYLVDNGVEVKKTTRRPENIDSDTFFFDLLNFDDSFDTPSDIVIFLAGVWNYQECQNTSESRHVNVDITTKLATCLLAKDKRVVLISSNTVFGGERPWCNEDDEHSPLFKYAEHKSDAEKAIEKASLSLNCQENLAIIRLTKLLSIETSPIPSWINSLGNEEQITPFTNLVFSPISVSFATRNVANIALSKHSGRFHLSGDDNVNYLAFSEMLAKYFGFNTNMIAATTSYKAGVDIPFLPKYSGLSMSRTDKVMGIKAQHISEVLDDLYGEYQQKVKK